MKQEDASNFKHSSSRLPTFAVAHCHPLYAVRNELGEGAFWDDVGERLVWVDILAAKVFVQTDDASYEEYQLPVMPSAIWKVLNDRAYLATEEGIGELELSNGRYRTRVRIEAERGDTRSNDGGVASDGSFWFGTMLRAPTSKGGSIYRVHPDLSVDMMMRPVGIPNTFLFPAQSNYALIGDSLDRRIYKYKISFGRLDEESVWLQKPEGEPGVPDGSVLIYGRAIINAEWDSGQLVAYDLAGRPYDSMILPVSRPTSCALNGSDGRTLYVTSARAGLSQEQHEREPLAGTVFAVALNLPYRNTNDDPARKHRNSDAE